MEVRNSQADVTFAEESLNRTTQYLKEIDETAGNLTKDHESYEKAMVENQKSYEMKMDEMKKKFNNSNMEWRKETLKDLNKRFSSYKVLVF